MIVLICGSREWKDTKAIRARLEQLPRGSIVIHGGADGADEIAGHVAKLLGHHVALVRALWDITGLGAGHRRNHAMLKLKPELVIAFNLDTSGTNGVIKTAQLRGFEVEEIKPTRTGEED